ncbi:ABC transporter permease [Faucicola boevrei]|uniref:ABC transporter permease n=1 Tax=Faucicola boevrei TaxID=346665 RepID=UPI000370EC41|nr:ABC transporter permease [Moraxella boevrei]
MTSIATSIKDFNKSFAIQLRVIYALLMREIITRYGRHNIGFAWLFVEPMLFTIGIATLWYTLKNTHGSDLPIIPFAITGYSTVLLWRNVANRVTHAVEANTGLLYHRNVKVIDVFLARMLLEVSGATMSFLILSALCIIVGLMSLPYDFLIIVQGWGLLIWFSLALGLIVGSLATLSDIVDRLWHTFTYLLFPLSGAAYMASWLPSQLREYVLYLPMVNATEIIRFGYYGSMVETYGNAIYLIKCNLVFSFLGLLAVRYVSKRVESHH